MSDYYREELAALRVDAAAYAKKYPALAPMLAGPGSDPDVERVLEGAAFLCARIRDRLSRNAPRLLQNLLRWTFPQALLPLPSMAMMRFRQQDGFANILRVPRGTHIASRPVNGVSCIYSTDHDVAVPAAQIVAVRSEPPMRTPWLKVTLHLRGNSFTRTGFTPLVLHLPGNYGEAAQRFFVLLRQVECLEVKIGGAVHLLPASAVRPCKFPLRDPRMPLGRRLNRAYMEIVRYFYLPKQLLFVQIEGLDQLPGAPQAKEMEISFCIKPPFERVPGFDRDSFDLGVVCASNIFPAFAEPITVDHTQTEYPLHPQDEEVKKLEILSVAGVTGLFPGGRSENYQSYEYLRSADSPYVYSVRFLLEGESSNSGQPEYRLMPLYADRAGGIDALQKHVLSVALTCCNRDLPDSLGIGDICLPTDDSPAQAVFENITLPSPMQPRPANDLDYWLYLSHRSANLLPQASAELLRAMLLLYIGDNSAAPERVSANRRDCDAILEFSGEEEERLIRGRPYRGWRLKLVIDPTSFGSLGGMYLFASALERFFGGFTTINNYARLVLEVAGTGECLEWPPRMGEKQFQ
ncbi:MAG: type VI secretion system baseplate subunit TssF [Candidatus Accumulibacter sp.]|jgi:type VI secretion system protein ImpG|nr:type VI secretion system baseplate subunit TssF [Accumulibacter sp.]